MQITPFKHQTELLDIARKKYLLPWDCGSGKTIGLILLLKKYNIHNSQSLIITIKSDKGKWIKVVSDFDLNATVMTKEEFKKATTRDQISKVYKNQELINFKKKIVAPSKLIKFNYVIIDEAHFFAHGTSMLNKSLMAYLKFYKPEYIWAATATPCDRNPWKLFYLGNILSCDWNYISFRAHFFNFVPRIGPRGVWLPKTTIGGRSLEIEIARYINFLGKAIKLEDCIDMPPHILIEEYFELTAEQKKAYKEIKEELAIVRNGKWHQICGGTLIYKDTAINDDGKTIEDMQIRYFKCQKIDRILELVNEHQKIFIVCEYRAEVSMLAEEIKKRYPDKPVMVFTGDNSAERPEMAKKTDEMQEVAIIATASCSTAYEAKTVPLMVFYSYNYRLEHYIQMIGRIRRINNPQPRTYLSLIVKDTIDEAVFKCIQEKKDFDFAIYHRDK